MKINTLRHEKLKQFLTTYSIHVFILLLFVNIGIYYTVRQYIHANGCMTMAQLQTDNRCLYAFNNQVYQKGNRSNPHNGHPCGTDITSVIPASHLANKTFYFLPNYVANICSAVANTPTPRLTATPTHKPTATSSPHPTAPHATLTPIATPQPHAMTAPPTQPAAATFTPTVLVTPSPTNAPIPTQPPDPNSAFVNLSLILPGINQTGNQNPKHPARTITVYLYNPSDDTTSTTVNPIASATETVTFDGTSTFTNTNFPLGIIPAGQYQLLLKIQQFVKQQLKNADGTNLFSLTPGQTATAQPASLLAGDINPAPDGDNSIDTSDYNAVLGCFGNNTDACALADLNDDGIVDGTDYNIFLANFRQYQIGHNIAVIPTPTAFMPSPTLFTVSPTVIVSVPTSAVITIAPTNQPELSATPTPASLIASITNKVFLTKFLDIVGILLLIGIVALGILRSKLFKKIIRPLPASPSPTPVTPVPSTAPVAPNEPVDSVFFVSVLQPDPNGKGIWVQLTGDAGQIEGFYHTTSVPQGFSRVKGMKKTEKGKTYIDIAEILPAA